MGGSSVSPPRSGDKSFATLNNARKTLPKGKVTTMVRSTIIKTDKEARGKCILNSKNKILFLAKLTYVLLKKEGGKYVTS